MVILIKDKEINEKIKEITNLLESKGLNSSKTNAVRYLLGIKKQNTKQRKWNRFLKEQKV